jgi:hypothetical protein
MTTNNSVFNVSGVSNSYAIERLVFGKSGKLEIRTIEMIDADIYQIKNTVSVTFALPITAT